MAEPWVKAQTIDIANPAPAALEFDASLGDRLAHTWKLTILKNGAAINLSGATITADMLRMGDRVTVLLNGSASGNVATVTFTEECYAVSGEVRGSLRIATGGAIITQAHCIMRVRRDDSDAIVAPGDIIPGIEDLLAQISACEDATDAATAAAAAATAATANIWRGEMGDLRAGLLTLDPIAYTATLGAGSYAFTTRGESHNLVAGTFDWSGTNPTYAKVIGYSRSTLALVVRAMNAAADFDFVQLCIFWNGSIYGCINRDNIRVDTGWDRFGKIGDLRAGLLVIDTAAKTASITGGSIFTSAFEYLTITDSSVNWSGSASPDSAKFLGLNKYTGALAYKNMNDPADRNFVQICCIFSGAIWACLNTANIAVNGHRLTTSALRNKTINCLGDSLTQANPGWWSTLATRTGCICNGYGLSSSRISVDYNDGAVLSFLNRYGSMATSADATIIFGGINDCVSLHNSEVTLGSLSSPKDATSFYGALMALIEGILTMMPTKKLFGVIPPEFSVSPPSPYINWMPSVQAAEREVYQHYNIPFADLRYDCTAMGTTDAVVTAFRSSPPSNMHPNTAGYAAICDVIQGMLERYIKV